MNVVFALENVHVQCSKSSLALNYSLWLSLVQLLSRVPSILKCVSKKIIFILKPISNYCLN